VWVADAALARLEARGPRQSVRMECLLFLHAAVRDRDLAGPHVVQAVAYIMLYLITRIAPDILSIAHVTHNTHNTCVDAYAFAKGFVCTPVAYQRELLSWLPVRAHLVTTHSTQA
jgi:hypothetical protein